MSGGFDPNTDKPFHLFLLAVACAGFWFAPGVLKLLGIPLVAWVASRWIVEAAGFLARKGEEAALGNWNGRYFAYHEYQVRIFWDHERIWIKAADVFTVLDLSPDAISRKKIAVRLGKAGYETPSPEAGECFSATGIVAYLNGFGDLETVKFRRWLERDVFAVLDKQREVGAGVFERHKIR